MSDFDTVAKNLEETQYKEIYFSKRTQRDKLRALRDEFGFVKTQPQKQEEENDNE